MQLRGFFQEAVVLLGALLRPAARSVRENSGLAMLSVVLAFGLWIFVTDAENPERTQVPLIDIPIEPVELPPDVALADELDPATVRVRVRVEENVLDSLTKEDFEATVNLQGLPVGTHREDVEVRPLTGRGNLRIVAVLPPQTTVTLAQLASKQVPVDVEMRGAPPSDYSVSLGDQPVETATVAGPQEDVAAVTRAVASVDVEDRTESFESAVKLEPRNQLGNLVQRVSVDPAAIDVKIEIEQQSFSRSLAVSPKLTGQPRQGYNLVGVSADPAVVTVFGPESYINAAAKVDTQPVNINDATEDVIHSVSLDLPPGVTVLGGVEVTVTANISAAPGQLEFTVPVSVSGLEGDVRVSGSLPSVKVFVFGPLPDLLELNTSDITASVDMSGKDPGTHKVKVQVTVPDGLEVRSVSPEEAEIILEPS
jgi:YbbR domain-containing protein